MHKKILQFSHSFKDNKIPPKIIANIIMQANTTTAINYLFDNNASNEQMTAYNQCDSTAFNRTQKSKSNNKLLNLLKLFKLLKQGQYDIVITHRYKPFLLTLILSRFFKKTQFYAIFHGNGSFRRHSRRYICRFLLNNNWTIITVSQSVQNDLLTTLGTTTANMQVVYNCLDMAEIKKTQLPKNEARQQLSISKESFVFGCIARLVPGKGLHYLLQAFAQLKTDTNAQLAIIGDGREKNSLEKQAQQLGIAHKVIFCGFQENAVRFAAAFDTFILPTTNEGFGLVLLEAAVAEIPIITTKIGGIPEVAQNTDMILVPAKDNNALLKAMETILDLSDDVRILIGKTTYKQLHEKFDIKNIAPEYYQLLGLD